MERENSAAKITVASKDRIQNWWRNKKLDRQAKVKRIQSCQTSFMDLYSQEMQEKKNIYKINPKQLENDNRNIYIIPLNLLSAPTKRHRLAKWIENKTHLYAVYKKPTSDLKTHIDWKWEDGKIYSIKMGSKRKLE